MSHFSGIVLASLLCVMHGASFGAADGGKGSELMAKMKAIKEQIFKDYDRLIRPLKKGENTTEVTFTIAPQHIIDLDEERSLFSMSGYFVLWWNDPRLKWNTTDFDEWLQFPDDMIWKPDISVFNSESTKVDPTHSVLMGVHGTGTVVWAPPVVTTTFCATGDPGSYPQDEVECELRLGSWTHDGWQIDYQVRNFSVFFEFLVNLHPRWELVESGIKVRRHVYNYECCDEPFMEMSVHFPMRRRPVPQLEATRAPALVALVLALAAFWLPPASSKKVLLVSGMLVALVVMLIYVAGSTKSPLAVPYAGSFLLRALYVVTTVLLLQVLIINVSRLPGHSGPPPALTRLLSGPLGSALLLHPPSGNRRGSEDRVQLREDAEDTEKEPTAAENWELLGSAMDRLGFFVLGLTVIAISQV